MDQLTHTDAHGHLHMVDVGAKPDQQRMALAEGFIHLQAATISLLRENALKKGDVLTTAKVAAIQAAKQTPFLIPLCHTLQLTKIDVDTEIRADGILVRCTARCIGKTGVEMEALLAVSVALLTIYDMCKAVDHSMLMSGIKLIKKEKQNIEQGE